jgi:hypothetical protein
MTGSRHEPLLDRDSGAKTQSKTGASARFERAVDAFESNSETWARMRAVFPSLTKVFLITCLALVSWFATYSGMLELISANTGEIGLIYRIAIAFAVATLMLMIIYILDTLFSPVSWWLRTLYIFGYVFLTLISVGFGFGYFWKFLEARAEATRSAEAAITQVQGVLQQGQLRLEQLGATLDSLATMSRAKAVDERAKGNTCPNSRPGDGPRRRLRDADATTFTFVSEFIGTRTATVANDFDALNADLSKVLSNDPTTVDPKNGTRNSFLRGINRRLDLTIARFNALRSDPQLREQRDMLAARAAKTQFKDASGGGFACPDIQLQTALRGTVKAIDGLPVIEKTDIAAVEGAEAIVEAFRRLTTTAIGILSFKLPPSPDELRAMQKRAISTAQNGAPPQVSALAEEPGLGSRDYIPLFIAIFVDFCILLVSVNRPINRFQMLVSLARDAREGPMAEILGRFHGTHQTGLAEEFEIFQHVVFDFLGDYYAAIPLSAKRSDARYLANLFVSLEGKGIVDRALLPPAFVFRRKLEKQGSQFAGESLFRLYRFRRGAWSKLVLDAVLGSSTPGAQTDANGLNGSSPHGPFDEAAAPPPAGHYSPPALPLPSGRPGNGGGNGGAV